MRKNSWNLRRLTLFFFYSCKFFPKSSNLASWFFVGFLVFFFFGTVWKQSEKQQYCWKVQSESKKKKKKSKIINNFSSFYRIRVKGFCFAFSRVQNHVIKRYFQRDRSLLCASVYVRMHTYQNLRRLWLCSREQQDTERLIFITTICLRSTSTDVHTTWNRSSKVTSKKWIWMIQNYGCINNLATA